MTKKKRFRIRSVSQCLAISTASGILAFMLTLALCAIIMTKYDFTHSSIKYFYILFSVISGFITGITAGRCSKSRSVIWAITASAILAVIIISFLLIYNGFSITLLTLIIIPICAISALIGGILSSNLR